MDNKKVYIIGGGTIAHMSHHLALAAPAYGSTARKLEALSRKYLPTMDTIVYPTKMADPKSTIETPEDIDRIVTSIIEDTATKIVFFNPAIVDFDGQVANREESGKYAPRLSSKEVHDVHLTPRDKIIFRIRNEKRNGVVRKDIFLVGFKATCGLSEEAQYNAGLNMLKASGCNLVLANDAKTRVNMVITPEEAAYHVTTDRDDALERLVEMVYLRSHLTFTHSTVISGEPVAWESSLVPSTLRTVVDYCISRGAYKRFRGVTAGHFAIKLDDQTFLTSRRKTDFNDMKNVGLVKVKTDGPDSVVAYGSKPSVGGQSQRIVFGSHPEYDCIVHFHCPIREESNVPQVSQREFECGSHQCGKNTATGLKKFGDLSAVYLKSHGPNIVFHSSIDPQHVIDFIEEHFDLTAKTGGYAIAG